MNEEFKKKWDTHIRNNEFELKMEIQRCWDVMQKYEPGSSEYEKVLDAYETLLKQEKDLKEIHENVSKIICGAVFTIGGWCVYRALFDKIGDPFFKEIGKNFIKFIPHV